jgi:dihydrofolate reductase
MKPINIIAARDRNGIIGYRGIVPWRLKEDMRIFREKTKRQNVIMGRKTWDSLPNDFKPLPIRRNIVVSKEMKKANNFDYLVARNLDMAFVAAENIPGETFVIGGGEIYSQSIDRAETLHLTEVDCEVQGMNPDLCVYFPKFDENDFEEVSKLEVAADIDNQFNFVHRVLKRK